MSGRLSGLRDVRGQKSGQAALEVCALAAQFADGRPARLESMWPSGSRLLPPLGCARIAGCVDGSLRRRAVGARQLTRSATVSRPPTNSSSMLLVGGGAKRCPGESVPRASRLLFR